MSTLDASHNNPFKECPKCKKIWTHREHFLSDTDLVAVGYQANFVNVSAGVYLFTHKIQSCETTLSVAQSKFYDLLPAQEIDLPLMRGSNPCGGHCLRIDDFKNCKNPCRMARAREILRLIVDWEKPRNDSI